MKLKRNVTIIFCKDIKLSKKFYSDVLNLTVDLDLTSVIFFKEGIAIWQVKPGHILKEKLGENFNLDDSKKFELYFELDDWQEVVVNLKKFEIKYLHDVHEEPWGQKTIRFFDPDENIIELSETLELFIRRAYEEGLTIEEIAKKNEITVEDVKKILQIK